VLVHRTASHERSPALRGGAAEGEAPLPLAQGAADDHPDGVVAVVGDVGVAAGVDRDRPRVVQPGQGRGAAVAGEPWAAGAGEQTRLPRRVNV